MNGKEFVRRARKWAKANRLPVSVDASRGKRGHQLLTVGDFRTTAKTGEIGEGLLNAMLGQLGIPKKGF